MTETIICAGFGGQGIMILGKVLAEAAMDRGLNVTWLPSYGAEVRGGTAHSMVKISSLPIASPVAGRVDTAIILNGPSLEKFGNAVEKGGLLIVNTSLTPEVPARKDIDMAACPLTGEALGIGNIRVANMIAAGIYSARKGTIGRENLVRVIEKMAGSRKELISVNIKAVEKGFDIAARIKENHG